MSTELAEHIKQEGLDMLAFSGEVALHAIQRGRRSVLERPAFASSWATHVIGHISSLPGVRRVESDMCDAGMQAHPDSRSEKRTGRITNDDYLTKALEAFQCRRNHECFPLENSLPDKAKVCPPPPLCKNIIKALVPQLDQGGRLPGCPEPIPPRRPFSR